jgi:hypothetical protein
LLKNGIFFASKRPLQVDIEVAPEGLPRRGEKVEINQYLEGVFLAIAPLGKEGDKPPDSSCFRLFLPIETFLIVLLERGHSRLINIAEVRILEESPLTGTGKTHYRMLEKML